MPLSGNWDRGSRRRRAPRPEVKAAITKGDVVYLPGQEVPETLDRQLSKREVKALEQSGHLGPKQ